MHYSYALTHPETIKALCFRVDPELSTGPFCVTRSDPTHQLTDPTQSNPLQVEKFGPNPTQPNTTNKFNCLVQPNLILPCFKCINVILLKFYYFCYGGPNPTHQKLKNLDPTQPNPWVNPTHGQLCSLPPSALPPRTHCRFF